MRKALFFALKSKSAGHFALFQTAGKPALPAIHKFQSQTKTLRLELKNEKLAENRNYKRVKDKDGNVVANIITVFGQDVEVSDEIFATYAQVDRRARYVGEDIPAQHELSLEQFEEEGVSLEKLIRETAPSAEEWFMEQEESNAFERELLKVPAVLDMLEDSDRQLINALFYKGISVREYAQRLGISHTMVRKRRDRILRNMKKYFSKD